MRRLPCCCVRRHKSNHYSEREQNAKRHLNRISRPLCRITSCLLGMPKRFQFILVNRRSFLLSDFHFGQSVARSNYWKKSIKRDDSPWSLGILSMDAICHKKRRSEPDSINLPTRLHALRFFYFHFSAEMEIPAISRSFSEVHFDLPSSPQLCLLLYAFITLTNQNIKSLLKDFRTARRNSSSPPDCVRVLSGPSSLTGGISIDFASRSRFYRSFVDKKRRPDDFRSAKTL